MTHTSDRSLDAPCVIPSLRWTAYPAVTPLNFRIRPSGHASTPVSRPWLSKYRISLVCDQLQSWREVRTFHGFLNKKPLGCQGRHGPSLARRHQCTKESGLRICSRNRSSMARNLSGCAYVRSASGVDSGSAFSQILCNAGLSLPITNLITRCYAQATGARLTVNLVSVGG